MKYKQEEKFLDLLKSIRQEKDVDEIGELVNSMITIYGLTVDEVCALSYYLIHITLTAKHNADFIAEHFNIDVNELGVDGQFAIAKAMLSVYSDKQKRL